MHLFLRTRDARSASRRACPPNKLHVPYFNEEDSEVQRDNKTTTLRFSTRTWFPSIGTWRSVSTMSSGEGRDVSPTRYQRRPGTAGTSKSRASQYMLSTV